MGCDHLLVECDPEPRLALDGISRSRVAVIFMWALRETVHRVRPELWSAEYPVLTHHAFVARATALANQAVAGRLLLRQDAQTLIDEGAQPMKLVVTPAGVHA